MLSSVSIQKWSVSAVSVKAESWRYEWLLDGKHFDYHGTCWGKQPIWHLEWNLGLVQIGEIYITVTPVAWHFRDLQWLYHSYISFTVSFTSVSTRAGRGRDPQMVGRFNHYISYTNRCHYIFGLQRQSGKTKYWVFVIAWTRSQKSLCVWDMVVHYQDW